ncbi:hypothetical protein ABVK25_003501 [Lepraria finkii]|uniref:L-dopachrome isomerase n=1 Tax=Lepraria finkii TaxID=1340010 RepID=A0ABR4BGB5_9LECA
MHSPVRGGNVSPIQGGSVSPISNGATTPTANDFPVPVGQNFTVRKRDKGLVSPSQSSSFSVIDDDEPPVHAITTPHRIESRAPSRKASIDLGQKQSVDGAAGYMCNDMCSIAPENEIRKKRSQFYNEVFAYREPNITPRDRIYKDSIVTVEVKTNVIVRDEYELLQDLSQHLSQRYQRPTSSIFIYLNHSACMLFGGTFDSAYILTITALPYLLQSTTNKRNAALLQAFLADSLGVSPARGLVRFMSIPDEHLAFNGTTVLGQIDNIQRVSDEREKEQYRPVKVGPTLHKNNSVTRNYRMISQRKMPVSQSVPLSRVDSPPLLPAMPTENSLLDRRAEKVQRLGKRKSFFNIFGRKDLGCG